MKISVIIPLYNKVKSIHRTIDSVLKQTYNNIEIIVVDDGSTDGSDKIIRNIHDKRVRYISKSNGGVSSARNYGVLKAKGDYIIFLDADDYFLPNAIEILSNTIKQYSVDCACANFYIQKNEILTPYIKRQSGYIKEPFKEWFFQSFCPRTGAAILKKNLLLDFPFPENIHRYEDACSLFDIMRSHIFYYTSELVMTYTDDNKGLSNFCKDYNKDFIFHMVPQGKTFWEKMIMAQLFLNGLHGYPLKRLLLIKKYSYLLFYLFLGKLLNIVYHHRFI